MSEYPEEPSEDGIEIPVGPAGDVDPTESVPFGADDIIMTNGAAGARSAAG